MSWLEFLSSTIGHIAWPFAFSLVAFWFRSELKGILSSLKVARLKVSGTEVEFMEAVEEAGKGLKETGVEDLPVPDQSEKLLEADPNYAVLDAWKELEASLVAISIKKFDNPSNWNVGRHLVHLVKNEVLSPELANALQELRTARNQIVHDKDYKLSKQAARRFVDIAADVAGVLTRLML